MNPVANILAEWSLKLSISNQRATAFVLLTDAQVCCQQRVLRPIRTCITSKVQPCLATRLPEATWQDPHSDHCVPRPGKRVGGGEPLDANHEAWLAYKRCDYASCGQLRKPTVIIQKIIQEVQPISLGCCHVE